MGEGRAPKVGPLRGCRSNCRGTRPSSVQGCIYKVNCRQARQGELRSKRGSPRGEGALGYKVNCRQAREGALGYKVNCRQAREGALGYKVNCAAREGALGCSVSLKFMLANFRAPY